MGDYEKKCPCCGEIKHALNFKTVRGHSLCGECIYEYADHMRDMQRDKEMEEMGND